MDGRSKADAEEFVKERGCVACLSRDCDSNLDGCVFSGKTFVSDRDTGGTGAWCSSEGIVVRCWRQVAGRSVKELLPYIWMGVGVGASRRVRSIKICSGAGVATYW
jgi:hypothetical protein